MRIKNTIISKSERKTLLSNFTWLMGLKIMGYIFPLATIPYLAKVIGPEGLGKVAFVSVIALWISTVSDWGFSFTATRDMSRILSDSEKMQQLYSNVFFSKLFLFLVCIFVLIPLSVFVELLGTERLLLFFSVMSVIGKILFPEWFFLSMEKMKYITIFSAITNIFISVLVFVFITEPDDYYLQVLLQSIGFFISGLLATILVYRKWHLSLSWTSIDAIKVQIKDGFSVFVSNFMPNLYNSFSRFLLYYQCGSEASGRYDVGGKFFTVANQMLNVLSVVFFPFLSKKISSHNLYAGLSISCSIVLFLILYFFVPILFPFFFTSEFSQSIIILKILAFSLPFLTISIVYGNNYMIINGGERVYMKIMTIMSIIGFVLSFPMVRFYKELGVAYVLLIVRIMTALCVFFICKKSIKRKNERRFI